MSKKKMVILTGAGMSAESGIKTFRDADGLWEGHDIYEVASPEGWQKDRELVLDFYNQRRRQVLEVLPNRGHQLLSDLEGKFDVQIITQNVDDLHERAGSTNVLHLHGELLKSRSSLDASLIYDCRKDILLGEKCEKGSQLRPHIVWFGEAVNVIPTAVEFVQKADIFVVIGTSLLVYPAAGLIDYTPTGIPHYIVDPKIPSNIDNRFVKIEDVASKGVERLVEMV